MNAKPQTPDQPYIFKKIRMYTAEEIIAAGGPTPFGKVSHYDPQALHQLSGEPLTEEDYQRAMNLLTK